MVASTKRLGSRYGVTIRQKFDKIETAQKQQYECPSCGAKRVKRLAAGIWQCRKCNSKFAGKCYSLSKEVSIKEDERAEDFGAKKKQKRVEEEE